MSFADGALLIEALGPGHDRAGFCCGNDALDRYLREQAGQDVRRDTARVFVAVGRDQPECILGFFSLSAASIVAVDLPPEAAKRRPRHPIPAALIGRLAVDLSVAGRGLGGILVADAVRKAMVAAEMVAMTVIVVDPIDDKARDFYAAFGFRSLLGPQKRMFLTLPRPSPGGEALFERSS